MFFTFEVSLCKLRISIKHKSNIRV
uniref:Uncharacterized protein n=1 Tax=Arundo donax TaxID=35708 RepID=A0A0A9C898_ARUDO